MAEVPGAWPEVVIPVFNAFEAVRGCLDSLDRTAPDARVVIVDDASTDTRVTRLMDDWVGRFSNRRLERLPRNGGFVKAANHGFTITDGDVVLLNSDTVATVGWLECLGRCLGSDSAIATATPWSNNGEIVSIPNFCANNPVPDDPDAVARAARRSRGAAYPELPTAVGFCMAVSRAALERVGLFDAESFGLGYGEENDFCRRAAAMGMRNVLCDDAFVVHLGGQSFAPLGLKPDEASMRRLLRKHPDYQGLVSDFIASDPLAERRAALARALALENQGDGLNSAPDGSGNPP